MSSAVAMTRASELKRENCFDFLRLFAALAVVVQHSVEHLDDAFLWFTPDSKLWFFDGVPLFFILSGMMVYRSCERCFELGRPLRDFYVNRFLRVAPAIYAYALITPFVLLGCGLISISAIASLQFALWLLSHAVLIPVYYPDIYRGIGVGVLNGSLWTIPVECGFYVVVPLLAGCASRFGRGALATVMIGLILISTFVTCALSLPWFPELYGKLFRITFLSHLTFFGLGIFWHFAWHRVYHHGALAAASLAFYVALRAWSHTLSPFAHPPLELVWSWPLSFLIMWVGHYGPAILRRIDRIGDLSYGVYVWHMVVVNLFLSLGIAGQLKYVPHLAVTSVVLTTLVVAFSSWRIVERPSLRLKPFSSGG